MLADYKHRALLLLPGPDLQDELDPTVVSFATTNGTQKRTRATAGSLAGRRQGIPNAT